MKRLGGIAGLGLVLALLLAGCGCEHNWQLQDCTKPMLCSKCGKEGETVPGHDFAAATCEVAKTCSVCGEQEGAALGHSWQAATCETAETCSVCGKQEGVALGHSWQGATCETAEICMVCTQTREPALGHNMQTWTPENNTMSRLCKRCGYEQRAQKDVDVMLRDNLLGTWTSCYETRPSKVSQMCPSVQTKCSFTFFEDGTMTYRTDKEYTGTWEFAEGWSGNLDVTLHCDADEMMDVSYFMARVGYNRLTVYEQHANSAKSVIYECTRDTAEEYQAAKELLVGQWENGFRLLDGSYNPKDESNRSERKYSAVFREDGTVDMVLEHTMSGNWTYYKNESREYKWDTHHYRVVAFEPSRLDFYTIHVHEDYLWVHVFRNNKNYVYIFERET